MQASVMNKVESTPVANSTLPILPIRGMVVFPYLVMPLMITDQRQAKLVDEALMAGKTIGLCTQKDSQQENPGPDDVYQVGTAATVLKMLRFPDGSVRFLVQGLHRISVTKVVDTEPYIQAEVDIHHDKDTTSVKIEALKRNVLELLKKVVDLAPSVSEEIYITAINQESASKLADYVASNLNLTIASKQELLEVFEVQPRLEKLVQHLNKEVGVLELSQKIQSDAAHEMGKMQRDYILREQLKAIRRELGEADDRTTEVDEFKRKIDENELPKLAHEAAEKELDRLSKMNPSAAEYIVSRTYLDWLTTLPWNRNTEEELDINKAEAILDEDHHGLEKVKERILEFLAVQKLKSEMKGPILCFVGPPGVGKTSLGRSIARSMGRKFQRIALGGMHDEAEIRGHRRTYIGSMPGRIIQAIRRCDANNPVLMLDEIDKIGKDFRGDPASALLEVLDPEQNNTFSDHYLDVPYDLSKVMFITTANILDTIPSVLLDRMEIIRIPGYTDREKLAITKKYLIGREVENHGLKKNQLTFTDDAILKVIRDYTRESGLRNLDREIATICRKIARKVATGFDGKTTVKGTDVTEYLGPERFISDKNPREGEVGVVPGLAYTSVGGDILYIEVTSMSGKGHLNLTGSLGDVMKESVQTALSCVRSSAEELGIDPTIFEKMDLHVHVPSGAVPKDGPSAGITIATALVSLLTNRPIRPKVSMTGEITLRGVVLPIGGLKEKCLGALRYGFKEIIIPRDNEKDLIDLPQEVKSHFKFHPVDHVEEVFAIVFPQKKVEKKKR
ncbi:MAG: endopeptidase La [Candidatus Zixiibacteriota bacterium]